MSKSPSTSTSTTVRRNQDQIRPDQTDQTRPDREHQTESIECRVRPNPLLARKDTKKEEERLRYQWDENKNLEKRDDDKFNILVTLFRAGSQKGAKRRVDLKWHTITIFGFYLTC